MSLHMFKKATKTQARLRFAISGVSGSGKTYSALNIAQHLGASIAVIDTEHGSASKYAGIFDFDVCNLTDHHPAKYVEAIKAAGKAGYEVIVIDSLSHAWFSELELAGKGFDGWKNVRPLERALIDTMLASPSHIITTMRTKTEWVLEEYTNKQGKTCVSPKRVGTSPVQASGIEYEFDVAGEIDLEHILTISKSRCPELSNTTHLYPGQELADSLKAWLSEGEPMPEPNKNRDAIAEVGKLFGVDIPTVKTIIKNIGRTEAAELTKEEVTECQIQIAVTWASTLSSFTDYQTTRASLIKFLTDFKAGNPDAVLIDGLALWKEQVSP